MTVPEGFGETVEQLRRSTVVVSSGRHEAGSGIIVDPEGLIVTNAHVVSTTKSMVQLWDGKSSESTLIARDGALDLALLSVDRAKIPAARFGNSEDLRRGEFVVAVGNPLGFIGAVTTGTFRAEGAVKGLGSLPYVQSALRLAPGNSGGPLANGGGDIVGVNSMVMGHLALAIPSAAVQRFINRSRSRASIGVIGREVPLTINGSPQVGLVLMEIQKGGSADCAALLPGDIIIGVNEVPFLSVQDLDQLLEPNADRVLQVQFLRGDRSHRRSVAIVLHPRRNRAA